MSWKKLVTSGSDASLGSLTVTDLTVSPVGFGSLSFTSSISQSSEGTQNFFPSWYFHTIDGVIAHSNTITSGYPDSGIRLGQFGNLTLKGGGGASETSGALIKLRKNNEIVYRVNSGESHFFKVGNSEIARITSAGVSASAITSSHISASEATIATLNVNGSATMTGSLSFNGVNFTETSIQTHTGSNTFGSLASDTHEFTGSVHVSNGIYGTLTGTSSFATNADTVDGVHAGSFLRSDTANTGTGRITLTGGLKVTGNAGDDQSSEMILEGGSPQIKFNDTTNNADDFWVHVNSNRFYVLTDRADDDAWESNHPLVLNNGDSTGEIYGNRILTTADEGPGNGLNADTLDGNHASAFLTSIGAGSIGDTELAFNTGQDLDQNATPTFHNLTIDSDGEDEDQLVLKHSGTYYMNIRHRGHFDLYGDNDFKFKHAGTTNLTISQTGNVGIGTEIPNVKLEVVGGTKISDGSLTITNPNAAQLILRGDTGNSGDTGQEDGIIDFLHDDQKWGYRINTENYSGTTALNIQEKINNVYTSRMYISNTGKVGIGNNITPDAFLHVMKTNDNTRDGIRIEKHTSAQYWDIYPNLTGHLYIQYNGANKGGYVSKDANTVQINFTGQHRSLPSTGNVTDYSSSVGLIVIADGTYTNFTGSINKPNINESLPKVALSSTLKDKRVFGVISDSEESGTTREYSQGAFVSTFDKEDSDTRLIVNSLGEGAIWITNCSGSLENGDYIT